MATINKDFKVKNGLIVEGTTGTINNHDILTKKTDDQNYIIGLIGGTATSTNTANAVVKRDGSGNFAAGTITANLTGDVTGNADTATALETARTISLAGDVTGSVSFDGTANVSITATIDGSFATDAEVATAKGEAISAAAADATSKANAAKSGAEATAAAALASAVSDLEDYADQAEVDAKAYTDTRETAITTAYQSYADTAESDAKAYADQKVADLVDGAPALLNTLNELAAAISDDNNFATTLTTSVGTKVSKAGDTMTGLLVLSADPSANLGAATKQYVDAAKADANAYADQAEVDAKAYTDTRETAITTAYQSYADTAEADAKTYADGLASTINGTISALDTGDVAEGSNLYYTAARAKAEAATLLANATKTNIIITKDGSDNLTITAENGVADSSTTDLAEGSNLYFTNARAVTALEAVVPNFTAVELNSVAKQVAATASIATASTNTAVSWLKAEYRSAEFLVKIANGSHTDVSKVILTLDTSDNVAITEYAMVGTNGSLGSVSADVSGNDVRLRVTTANNTSTVAVIGTLLA
jgi:thiaminase